VVAVLLAVALFGFAAGASAGCCWAETSPQTATTAKVNRRIIEKSAPNDMICAMRSFATLATLFALFSLATIAPAQGTEDVTARGAKVFQETCSTGYCHGAKGTASGAPRLVGRGFDQAFITATVTRGVPGTAMRAFGASLDRRDLTAVIAYVASLNGIAAPGASASGERPASALSPEAARGRDLFFDATRSFARCSTCHEVNGMGIPVATPIVSIPADVPALRSLATPAVRTAVIDGDSMPVLVVSEGKRRTIVYDLTSAPPVLRTDDDPARVKLSAGTSWKHSSAMGSYSDAELSAILAYLKAAI
jgi:mono/diheme cytochrome c family protein